MKVPLACIVLAASAAASDFHVDIGVYYGVPAREVIVLRERQLPDYEIPVALLVAQRARVAPAVVVNMRLGGRQWADIGLHYGLGPEIFAVPAGPPYGRAHGYWKKRPRDIEIIDTVNVRFLSDYYRVEPAHVVALRGRGHDFVAVHTLLHKSHGRGRYRDDDDDDHHGRGKHGKRGKHK